jgi:hypothetical protein
MLIFLKDQPKNAMVKEAFPPYRLCAKRSLNQAVSLDWQKMDREQMERMIAAVRSSTEAMLFSPSSSEVMVSILPFYSGFSLYKLTNYASLPIFTMEFLGSDAEYIFLDGSHATLIEANKKDGLRLSPRNILMYIDFFFSHVEGDDGEVHSYDQRASEFPAGLALTTPQINYDADTQAFSVNCQLYVDGSVMNAHIAVDKDGDVRIQSMAPCLTADAVSAFNANSSLGKSDERF